MISLKDTLDSFFKIIFDPTDFELIIKVNETLGSADIIKLFKTGGERDARDIRNQTEEYKKTQPTIIISARLGKPDKITGGGYSDGFVQHDKVFVRLYSNDSNVLRIRNKLSVGLNLDQILMRRDMKILPDSVDVAPMFDGYMTITMDGSIEQRFTQELESLPFDKLHSEIIVESGLK